jgi:hypothetical protein
VTTAPAAPIEAVTTTPAKPSRNVEHYFWVKNIEAAQEMGVQMRSL